jgi:hypothetical protein
MLPTRSIGRLTANTKMKTRISSSLVYSMNKEDLLVKVMMTIPTIYVFLDPYLL